MLDKLVEEKNRFVGKFTEEVQLENMICTEMKSEYLQWLAKLATYSDRNLKKEYPEMTTIVLSMVRSRSTVESDFNILVGYLDVVKAEKDRIKANSARFGM